MAWNTIPRDQMQQSGNDFTNSLTNPSRFGDYLFGKPEEFGNQSVLNKEQQPILSESIKAVRGAPQTAANYYRGLLSDDSEDFNAFARPELRRFNEQIVPDLAEQFAGMGSGGLESSGFRNAAVSAGADLSERLGALRANLRQSGVQGLQNMTNTALGQYQENYFRPESHGLVGGAVESFAEGAGKATGAGLF